MTRADFEAAEAERREWEQALISAAADVDAALLALQRTSAAYVRVGGHGATIAMCAKARLVECSGLIAAAIQSNAKHDFDSIRGCTVKTVTQNRIDHDNLPRY